MRELATELTVTPGALYRHFDGQAQLTALMIDAVMDQVAMPGAADEADPWKRIRIHVRSLTETLDEYPGLDQLVAGHGDDSAPARMRQRWFLQQLQDGGLVAADARRAYGVIYTYWLGSRQPPRRFAKAFYFGLDRLIDGLRSLENQR
jgi:AcrR family transcriptional regulator